MGIRRVDRRGKRREQDEGGGRGAPERDIKSKAEKSILICLSNGKENWKLITNLDILKIY